MSVFIIILIIILIIIIIIVIQRAQPGRHDGVNLKGKAFYNRSQLLLGPLLAKVQWASSADSREQVNKIEDGFSTNRQGSSGSSTSPPSNPYGCTIEKAQNIQD